MTSARRKYTDQQLADAVRSCDTIRGILIQLGIAPYGGNYETVRRRIAKLGLVAPKVRTVQKGRPLSACSDVEMADAVKVARSVAQVMELLGLRPGGNQARLSRRVQRLGLDTSHFMGQ